MTLHLTKELGSPFTPHAVYTNTLGFSLSSQSSSSSSQSPPSSSSSLLKCSSSTSRRSPSSSYSAVPVLNYFPEEDTEKQAAVILDHYDDGEKIDLERGRIAEIRTQNFKQQQQSNKKKKTFWPELLGLRGLASLMVLRGHVTEDRELMGLSYLSIFFVMSGFLITQSILAELARLQSSEVKRRPTSLLSSNHNAYQQSNTDKAALSAFAIKRFIRLLPGAVIALSCTTLLMIINKNQYSDLLFFNLLRAISLLENGSSDFTPWRNFWSLSVEIWCYLLFVFLIPRLHRLGQKSNLHYVILSGLALLSLLISSMQLSVLGEEYVWIPPFLNLDWKFGFWGNLYKFLMGAATYFFMNSDAKDNNKLIQRTIILGRKVSFPCFLIVAHFPDLLLHRPHQFYMDPSLTKSQFAVWQHPIACLLSCWLICSIVIEDTSEASKKGKKNFLASAPLCFIGRISYSLYLWQHPLLFVEGWSNAISIRLGITALAFVAAMASTLLIEEPVQAWLSSRLLLKKPPISQAYQETIEEKSVLNR